MNEYPAQLVNHVQEERKFLHDISNHLLIAQGMGSFAAKQLRNIPDLDEAILNKMEKSLKAMDRMVDAMKARRSVLHNINAD